MNGMDLRWLAASSSDPGTDVGRKLRAAVNVARCDSTDTRSPADGVGSGVGSGSSFWFWFVEPVGVEPGVFVGRAIVLIVLVIVGGGTVSIREGNALGVGASVETMVGFAVGAGALGLDALAGDEWDVGGLFVSMARSAAATVASMSASEVLGLLKGEQADTAKTRHATLSIAAAMRSRRVRVSLTCRPGRALLVEIVFNGQGGRWPDGNAAWLLVTDLSRCLGASLTGGRSVRRDCVVNITPRYAGVNGMCRHTRTRFRGWKQLPIW